MLTRGITVDDVTTGLKDGSVLVALLEVLTEKKFTGKMDKKARMRVQQISNCNQALDFVWSCGLVMKVKPSAEGMVLLMWSW